jgi:acyl carrier protein
MKDVIIIRGVKYHPQDIEYTAATSHPGLRIDACAAFTIGDTEDRLVIVQEVINSWRGDYKEIIDAIQTNVMEEYGLPVHGVKLVRHGSIHKTTSGKIQRHKNRMAFENGGLEILEEWSASNDSNRLERSEGNVMSYNDGIPPERNFEINLQGEQNAAVRSIIVEELARILEVPSAELSTNAPLSSLGLDSLQMFRLRGAIMGRLNMEIDVRMLFEVQSVSQLAERIDTIRWLVQPDELAGAGARTRDYVEGTL